MKKLNFILAAAFVMLMLFGFQSKAQSYPFTNNLGCDVTIGYESWASGCTIFCGASSFVIPAGQTFNLPTCSIMGYGICIIILEIDYTPVTTANHAAVGPCHVLAPYGQSGTLPTTCGGGTYNALVTASGWSIN